MSDEIYPGRHKSGAKEENQTAVTLSGDTELSNKLDLTAVVLN